MRPVESADHVHAARLLDRVRRLAEDLARAHRTHDVCSALVCAALDAVAADGARLYLSQPHDGSLRLTAASGEVAAGAAAVLPARSSEPAALAYRSCEPRWRDAASSAHVPLVVGDLCYGVLSLAFADHALALTVSERSFLEALAGLGAAGVERVRAIEADRNAGWGQRELLGVVAHELRHPLSVILVRAALLREHAGTAGTSADRDLEVLVKNATRLGRMIQDALDYAQIAQRRVRIQPRVIDARELLTRVVDDAPEPWRVIAESPPSRVVAWCDLERTAQALDNLVRNALKFSTPETQVRVSLEALADEVVVRIRDRGCGIPAHEVPHLFDPPHESAPRRARAKRSGEGAGLGLFITRRLIEAQGGRLWAVSTEGEGSQFSVSLRRAAPAGRVGDAGVVLVVEAEVSLRRELVDVLSRAGFHATGVAHGAAALEYLRGHPAPVVVLSGLRMPVMSGWELCEQMRADPALREIPVVALTSGDSSSEAERFAGRLTKPLTVSELIATADRFAREGATAR